MLRPVCSAVLDFADTRADVPGLLWFCCHAAASLHLESFPWRYCGTVPSLHPYCHWSCGHAVFLADSQVGQAGAALLAPAFGKLTRLQVLDLESLAREAKNKLGAAEAKSVVALAPELGKLTQLHTLNLGSK